ncbi:MAG: gamma-glutamyl-gamma-aminobutyrate hydrolase family protein [Candidatus Aminicenantales bacterium]
MKILARKLFLAILTLFFLTCFFLTSAENIPDETRSTSERVRLTIFYPSVGSIRCLQQLRKQNFLTVKDLIVVGIYHEKELTRYEKAEEFVQENDLDWFVFHRISAELDTKNLYGKNSLTPEFEDIFKKSDGIIFFGGGDIPPVLYGEKTNLLTHIQTPYRHFLELSFIFHLLGGFQDEEFTAFIESAPDFPVLGICLGCQSLNVGTGGTLIQDIPSQIYRKENWEDYLSLSQENWHLNPFARLYPEKVRLENLSKVNMHPIKLMKGSKFVSELGFSLDENPYVLSAHHQMVDKLGKGMKFAAASLDGKVVEAIEHQKYPHVLGVQFHPESDELLDESLKIRIRPDDKQTSLLSILKSHPPSYEFHRKIWGWFSEKIEAFHRKRARPSQ